MTKKIWKILRGTALLGLLTVLAAALCLIIGHVFRELGRLPRTVAGDGWEQGQTERTLSITPQEFSEHCAWLENYLEENGIAEAWQWSRDERVWERIDRILVYDGRELSGGDLFLYQELVYAAQLREREKGLPDYYNYLSETEGVLNEIWMYVATEQKCGIRQNALAALTLEAADALRRQQAAGFLYPAGQMETAVAQCRQLLEEGFLDGAAGLKEAVEGLLLCLKELDGTEEPTGLCQLPMGADYYEALLERKTGSGLGAEEMYERLSELRDMLMRRLRDMERQVVAGGRQGLERQAAAGGRQGMERQVVAGGRQDMERQVVAGGRQDIERQTTADGQQNMAGGLRETDAAQLLELLTWNTRRQFRDMGSDICTLRELPELLKNRSYIGFYRKNIMDGSHVIYIDSAYASQNAYEKYEMLAHEGYPGHLYCSLFQEERSYDRLGECLASRGYSEGWAVYSEFLAAQWLGEEREGYEAFLTQKLLDETILCQMDIGIHALGWGEAQLRDYCGEVYGEIRPEGVVEIGGRLSGQPAMYQPYVVGYMKVCQLEERYMENGHSREEFVEWFLRHGQAAFTVIEQYENLSG